MTPTEHINRIRKSLIREREDRRLKLKADPVKLRLRMGEMDDALTSLAVLEKAVAQGQQSHLFGAPT